MNRNLMCFNCPIIERCPEYIIWIQDHEQDDRCSTWSTQHKRLIKFIAKKMTEI